MKNFEIFFNANILEGSSPKDDSNPSPNPNSDNAIVIGADGVASAAGPAAGPAAGGRNYWQTNYPKKEGHVGIRNLGCICYMNSMMQQFFMVPTLRYNIMQVNDAIAPQKDNALKIDDNVLHQVQRMFTFLELSEREDYNPQGFCHSFKDYDGNPTNTIIQQDSQEFLNRFFDKIENCLKPTPYKYLMQSVFGGKTCSQLLCENGCGSSSNKFEDFYNLSLEVTNMKTLNDSLEKFIHPEQIDEYFCEKCQKKVTITKRNSLAELPNVLFVHLQRIYYNYESDRNEKINSRLEFPKVLNLKNYCIEELMSKSRKKAKQETETEKNDEEAESENIYETDDIYFKHPDYYEYCLVGVNVHSGTAEGGHYFSYINTQRNGSGCELLVNPDKDAHNNSWLKFNDSYISKFNSAKLEEECFGGSMNNDNDNEYVSAWNFSKMMDNSQSAYLLIYERRVKNPLKIIVKEPQVKDSVVFYKEEEANLVKKKYDTNSLKNFNERDVEFTKKVLDTVFYDAAKNEYYQHKNFFENERLVPKDYYFEVTEDNTQFQKQQNILDDQFITFFENVINTLDDTLTNTRDLKKETINKICLTLLHFIFNILSTKEKQKLLKPAVEKFLHIIELNEECVLLAFEYILNNRTLFENGIFNDDIKIIKEHANLLFELIKKGYNNSPEEFLLSNYKSEYGASLADKTCQLVDIIISFFPRISNRYIQRIYPLYELIKKLSFLGDQMIDYLYSKQAISLFISYLLGRNGPCYIDYVIKSDHWDLARGQIVFSEPLIELVYNLYKKSKDAILEGMEDEEEKQTKSYTLGDNDRQCLKSAAFLKYVYKHSEKYFPELMVRLSTGDEEFSTSTCSEITKYIDEVAYYEENELVKIVKLIIPILNINDEYQLNRYEIILGYPNLLIDEPNLRSRWPIFGYNRLGNENSKLIEHRSVYNLKGSCSLFKKMCVMKSKDKMISEILIMLLDNCRTNHGLLKYINSMPSEEPAYESFILWCSAIVILYANRTNNNTYLERLKLITAELEIIIPGLSLDKSILKNFSGFPPAYVIRDIKREEISLISSGENLYIMKFEYFGNYSPVTQDFDYSNSVSYYGPNLPLNKDKEENIIDETQNIEASENTTVFDLNERPSNDRDFIKKIIPYITLNKKIVIQNKYKVVNPVSILVRYVVYNSYVSDATCYMKFRHSESFDEFNEFIPQGTLNLTVNSFNFKNALNVLKIDPEKNWTESTEKITVDTQFAWQYRSMSTTSQPSINMNDYFKKRSMDEL